MEIDVGREITATAERVWAIITDVDGFARALSGVALVERLDDKDDFGVGTRWRETRVVFGKESTEEIEVTAVEAGRGYTTRAASRGTTYTSVIRVEPRGREQCRLSMSFSAVPAGLANRVLGATLGRLFQGATRKMLLRDLDDIAVAAESTAAM